MDLKSKNKVLNIILSVLIFLLIFAPAGGLVCGFMVSEVQIIYNGNIIQTNNLLELFENAFNSTNNLDFSNASAAATSVCNLLSALFFLGTFFAAGIIVIINSIILLVQTIKGLSKGVPSGKITKPLLRIAVSLAGYVSIMLGMYFYASPGINAYIIIGVGPMVQLGVALLYIIIASVMHFAVRSDHKTVGKVFQTILTLFAFVTLIILFITPFKGTYSMLNLFINMVGYTIVSEDPQTVYITILGAIGFGLLIAAFFTLTKVVTAPMGGNAGEKKKRDYGISAIIRSAVFAVLFAAGFVFIAITILRLHMFTELKFTAYSIAVFVAVGVLLALAIVAKSVDKMSPVSEEKPIEERTEEAPQEEENKEEPVKEESTVLEEPQEDNPLEKGEEDHDKVEEEKTEKPVEEKKEEVVVLVAEEPKPEETKPEMPAGPKFCPNCGTPTNGSKFCPNCGTKLL